MSPKTNDRLNVWIASVVCLLPMILSAVVYGDLPDKVAIHWNAAGEPDNYAHKAVAAFGLPVFFLIVTLIVALFLLNDPKRANGSPVIRQIGIWIAPLLSLIMVPVTLFIAMGADIPIVLVVPLIVGIVFVIIGNYLPKGRQNYTVGVRLPWTLNNEDNWNKTNRLTGYLFMLGGIVMIAGAFFAQGSPAAIVSIVFTIIAVLVIVPVLYSYLLHRRAQ